MPAFVPVHPPRNPDECAPWLYEALQRLNRAATSSFQATAAVVRGESPDSSGDPLNVPTPDLTEYFKLIGRSDDQVARGSIDSAGTLTLGSTSHATKGKIFLGVASPRVAVDETSCLLGIGTDSPAVRLHTVTTALGTSTVGALGTVWARFGYASTTKLDIAPLLQVAGTVDAAIQATTGGIQFFDSDFTGAAFRMAFSSNRSFLQAGRINSSSVAVNRNLTIGGINATVGATSQINFQGLSLATTSGSTEGAVAISANDALVTVNLSADDYLTSLAASRPSLLVGPRANSPTCAPLVAEQGSTTVNAFEYRGASTGSAPAKVLGLVKWAFGPGLGGSNTEGSLIGYRSGSETVRLQPLVASSSNWAFISPAQLNQLEHLVFTGLWSDSLAATTTRFSLGDTASSTRVVGITSGGGNIMDRFGVCTRGFTVENTTLGGGSAAISAPVSLLYLVNNVTNGDNAKIMLSINAKRTGQTGDLLQIISAVSGTVDNVWNARNVHITGRIKTAVLFTDDNATIASSKLMGFNVGLITAGQTRTLTVTDRDGSIATDANVAVDDAGNVITHDGNIVLT